MSTRSPGLAVFAFLASVLAGVSLSAAQPVEYVRICDAFGAGFYYIPGTDTCLKVGGYARAEGHWVDGDPDPGEDFNNWTTRARGEIDLDAQTQTDFGLIRAFIALEITVGPGEATTSGIDSDPNYGDDDNSPDLSSAFVQLSNDWGTFTAGHSGSFFDFFGSHGYGTRVTIDDNTGEQTLFAWTFAPASVSGLSFTLSAEDPASGGRRLNDGDDYEGQEAPDGVGNIRLEQDWGVAQVMGVLRHINDISGDGLGFAAGAGVTVNLPGSWTFDAQGGYSEGAISYLTFDPGGVGDFEGPTGDDTNSAWMIRGGFTGPAGNNLTAWIDGSYTHAETQTAANVEYDFWAVQVGGAWEPAPGLTLGPEFAYTDLDFDAGGTDQSVFGLMWRVERSF